MKIDVILSYESKPQQYWEKVNSSLQFLSKEEFANEILQQTSWADELAKISVCAYIEPYYLPKWYLDCNGKLYFKNGKLVEDEE